MSETTDLVVNDLGVREELDALRLLVEATEGNVITFVLFRTVAEREAAVQYLMERLSVPVVEVALSKRRTDPLEVIEEVKGPRACVQVYDLEAALPDATKFLNLKREAYAALPHALVLWVGEHGLREVARNAPDFWAWRSGVFDARTEQPGVRQAITQQALRADVRFTDRGDLERRASLYQGLIREYEKDEEVSANEIAYLRYKWAILLYLLRDFEGCEQQALAVQKYAESVEDEALAAAAYHQFGMIAEERRDFDAAEAWYEKSLEIKERQGNEHGAASTYHHLGRIAQERRDFDAAESWYQKSLEIEEGQGNEHGAAITYHQLGIIAEERRDFDAAESWYKKSLEIAERQGDEHGAASTYHQFGMIAEERRDFDAAASWYQKSLEITERQGNEHGAAITYHQLGIIAEERRDFDAAELWYEKSLEIKESQGDEHGAAQSYGQIAILLAKTKNYIEAGQYFLISLSKFAQTDDLHSVRQIAENYQVALRQAPEEDQTTLRKMWEEAGLPPLPEAEEAA